MKKSELFLSDEQGTETEVLRWLAVLLDNRNLLLGSPVEKRGKEYILSQYLPDISDYDYLIGYRADDSYFSFARAFLSNTITVGQLAAAMHFGDLGLQYVLKSRRMFEQIRYETGDTYWAGYFIAYYQWEKRKPFQYIFSVIKERDLLRLYPTLHTASEEKGIEVIDRVIAEKSCVSRLQMYRKQIGLSQQQLAERFGVNIRTLQQFEVGRKELRKAAADTLFALAGTLGCRPEALLN